MKKKYDTKNFYSNFSVLNNRTPEQQFYAVTIPDYVTVTYSCIVYTYYVEQLNGIVEAAYLRPLPPPISFVGT